jgi:hypothetical protein
MTDQREEAASPDPLSPPAQVDSSLTDEVLTEVSLTETLTVTELMAGLGSPELPPLPPLTAVQLALQAGWTMAVLYGNIQSPQPGSRQLPTVHELLPDERRQVELARLRHLLTRMAQLPEFAGSSLSATLDVLGASEARLEEINLAILKALAATSPETELAYQLGRSLHDTVTPPRDSGELSAELSGRLARGRVAKLQEWLATLSSRFPQHAAAIVATSVGRWSDFAMATISTSTKTRLADKDSSAAAEAMADYLLPQGDLWLMLLTGARSVTGLLSPEGYAAAGEAALRRSARIVRGILRHYWFAWLILAVVTASLLYLSIRYLGGAAKVWTSIGTLAGSLGISARSITAKTAHLTAEAERPVFAIAEEDAMAWAITTLPPVKLTLSGVRRLKKAGIAPPSDLGRI